MHIFPSTLLWTLPTLPKVEHLLLSIILFQTNPKTINLFIFFSKREPIENHGYQSNYVLILHQTTVQGLPSNVPMKKLLKSFRKVLFYGVSLFQNFHCNGCVVDDEKFGQVIQLQGDHRADIQKFLVSKKIVKAENIRIHG